MAKEVKVAQDKDVVFVINKLNGLTTFRWGLKKIVFPYNIPVEVDFTDTPELLSNLLQCSSLQICTKKELAAYVLRAKIEATAPKAETSNVQKDSEVEKLFEEGSNV